MAGCSPLLLLLQTGFVISSVFVLSSCSWLVLLYVDLDFPSEDLKFAIMLLWSGAARLELHNAPSGGYKCGLCDFTASVGYLMAAHVKKTHKGYKKCKRCNQVSTSNKRD